MGIWKVVAPDGARFHQTYDEVGYPSKAKAEAWGRRFIAQHGGEGTTVPPRTEPLPAGPPSVPAIPLAASPPLSRADTIRELCALYGHPDRMEYFTASDGTPTQVVAALGLLGKRE